MPDDTLEVGHDKNRISIQTGSALRYWARSFGCTVEQLRQAVEAVGTDADALRRYLRQAQF